jgi:hypothetical protein
MFRWLKRNKAIKSYVYKTSLELCRRFGEKTFYSLDEVAKLFEAGKYDNTFSTYAYALFCSRADFDSYFGQLKLKCTYLGLRRVVAKKYFGGIIDFNAGAVVRFAKGVGNPSYDENNIGTSAGTDNP